MLHGFREDTISAQSGCDSKRRRRAKLFRRCFFWCVQTCICKHKWQRKYHIPCSYFVLCWCQLLYFLFLPVDTDLKVKCDDVVYGSLQLGNNIFCFMSLGDMLCLGSQFHWVPLMYWPMCVTFCSGNPNLNCKYFAAAQRSEVVNGLRTITWHMQIIYANTHHAVVRTKSFNTCSLLCTRKFQIYRNRESQIPAIFLPR